MAKISDWQKIDCRVGLIESVEDFFLFPKHYFILSINFGRELGQKRAVIDLTENYEKDGLLGKKIAAVLNVKPIQIGPWLSEVRIPLIQDVSGKPVLVISENNIPFLGAKINS